MGAQRRQRWRWTLRASVITVLMVIALARAARGPVSAWLGIPWDSRLAPTLVAAATVTLLGLGGASLWHAAMLPRLVRVRPIDVAIAALGVGVLALAIAIAVLGTAQPALATAILLLASPLWLAGIVAAGFALSAFLVARVTRRAPRAATVLILGAGLRGREVGPLLRRRVERGAQAWRTGLPGARIVVAGGQGRDEVRTEASAMAEHLVRHLGVPAGSIDLEEASTTTRENLERSLPFVSGPDRAPLVVVTSDYHAYRTSGLLDRVGLDGTVVGAPTRRSYLPGAMVREVLAVARDRWWWCVAIAAAVEAAALTALLAG